MKTLSWERRTDEITSQQPTNLRRVKGVEKLTIWISLVVTLITLTLSHNAFGADAHIGPIKVERLAIIETNVGGHIPGNMEVKVLNGFTIPPGMTCTDTQYLTTRKTTDPDRSMFYLLLKAKTTPPTAAEPEMIYLWITDNPSLAAFPNRCSIEAVDVY